MDPAIAEIIKNHFQKFLSLDNLKNKAMNPNKAVIAEKGIRRIIFSKIAHHVLYQGFFESKD